jgi:hypothetical protein
MIIHLKWLWILESYPESESWPSLTTDHCSTYVTLGISSNAWDFNFLIQAYKVRKIELRMTTKKLADIQVEKQQISTKVGLLYIGRTSPDCLKSKIRSCCNLKKI